MAGGEGAEEGERGGGGLSGRGGKRGATSTRDRVGLWSFYPARLSTIILAVGDEVLLYDLWVTISYSHWVTRFAARRPAFNLTRRGLAKGKAHALYVPDPH